MKGSNRHLDLSTQIERDLLAPVKKKVVVVNDVIDDENELAALDIEEKKKILKLRYSEEEDEEANAENKEDEYVDIQSTLPESELWQKQELDDGRDLFHRLIKLVDSHRDEAPAVNDGINKVTMAFRSMATILSRYKYGKLPKLLKIAPRLKDWEIFLAETNPQKWSPQATYQITRIFASNSKAIQAQNFYNIFLLPKVQNCIRRYRKLHVSLYQSLEKAVMKPGAWLRGILLPLVYDGCTYKEAMIVGSVISKLSFPNPDICAALYKLLETRPFPDDCPNDPPQWYATTSYFITIIFEKLSLLPSGIGIKVAEFVESFAYLTDRPPLVWYQGIIAYFERNKSKITTDVRDRVKAVVKGYNHAINASVMKAIAPDRVYNNPVNDSVMNAIAPEQ